MIERVDLLIKECLEDKGKNIGMTFDVLFSVTAIYKILRRAVLAGEELVETLSKLEDNPSDTDMFGWYSKNAVDEAVEKYHDSI